MSNPEMFLNIVEKALIILPLYGLWVTACILKIFKRHDRQAKHYARHT